MTPRETSEKLLRELDALDARGEGESIEADSIYDEMGIWWDKMTEKEQQEIDELSVNLYKSRKSN